MGPRPPEKITISAREYAVFAALVRCLKLSPTMVLKATSTPRSCELRCEEEGVGVLPVRRKHLGAGCDNLCDHVTILKSSHMSASNWRTQGIQTKASSFIILIFAPVMLA